MNYYDVVKTHSLQIVPGCRVEEFLAHVVVESFTHFELFIKKSESRY